MQHSKRYMDVKKRLLDHVGEGNSGTIWENNIETCISPYIKWMISANSMNEAEHPKLVLWDRLEKWGGDGGGRGVQNVVHMYTYDWFMLIYGKNNHNIVK